MNLKYYHRQPRCRQFQHGAATLLVTVIILLLISLITYTMTRTTTLENRMTAADLRSKQALHAAQAGLDFALQQMMNGSLNVLNTTCGVVSVDIDADGNPIGGTPSFQLLYGADPPECPSLALGLQTRSVVRSIGRSPDGSAIRILEVAIDLEREWEKDDIGTEGSLGPPLGVDGGVITRGGATFSGTASVAACELDTCKAWAVPGASWQPQTNNQSYSGALVSTGGSVTGGTGTGVSGSRLYPGQGHINQDPALALMDPGDFFQQTFGVTKGDVIESLGGPDKLVKPGEPLPDFNVNPVIWIDGDHHVGANSQLGTPEKPVVLIVDGNFSMGANAVVWGVVYFTESLVSGVGTAKVVGALVGENDVDLATGNMSVLFNSQVARAPILGGDTGETATGIGAVLASFDVTSWREIFF